MSRYLITMLCLGSLIGCLFYLGIDDSLKYDYDTTFVTLTKPVSYGSACAALFFGMYALYGGIALLYVKVAKSDIDKISFEVHGWFLFISGILYILHYMEILTIGSKERIGYTVGFILVVYLRHIYAKIRQI